MSTLEIILILGLIPITAFNIYYFTIGRKKKQAREQYCRQIISELERKTIAEMEKNHLQFDEKQAFINDAGEGVQLSFSNDRGQMAITLKEAFHWMHFSDVKGCTVRHDEANGKYSNIRVEIKTTKKVITIVFGTRAWRPKSFVGKLVLENAMEFCNLVKARCKLSA